MFKAALVIAVFLCAEEQYFIVPEAGASRPIGASVVEQESFTEADAVMADAVAWEQLEKGLSIGTVSLMRADTTGSKITLLKIDTAFFGFKVIGEPGTGQDIDDLVTGARCAAGINGGYYYFKNDQGLKMPLGLAVQDSREISAYKGNYSGCFFASQQGTGIAAGTACSECKTGHALQSFPLVIRNGKIPPHLKEEGSRLHIHTRSRRSAVGVTWKGHIVFLNTVREISFFELAFCAGALGLKDCLTLDGGGSSQMAVFSKRTIVVPGLEKVPLAIGAYRK
ncbi:MAG: hypothetical protein A2248_05905 [Candidatus Raymondbacteria bacterium RIFOXYA2_FULL_49_16]|uniref:Phosphodiester glycosidase domain-containing protein n=1 Tax=Candidatus Raymondbacteria bacterium RIFOXYD12_FULL_49_13 TaxID=1817890 RepID=A0A1F7FAU2_UNCRA|nr:MAG: hypothetical protein A2248_05905 [Candidatus Raymondbacteria bacterium RIFOXYA2_FULL_49_16]OGK03738.1 MAG: hypothetical protein A2519_01970 [Candidatus Raymondbacteria bacterium RIFOXYD12_FULL_49_13]OGP44842.1 MAG: hypothetical protein A2324_21665 [Candidatus Raymondbacteria bacterium RIFOXYB2_FULL_49_35]